VYLARTSADGEMVHFFNGLVCWGESSPETMVFTIKYRAFRLKFSHNPILRFIDDLFADEQFWNLGLIKKQHLAANDH
jgi:hypothetical protein